MYIVSRKDATDRIERISCLVFMRGWKVKNVLPDKTHCFRITSQNVTLYLQYVGAIYIVTIDLVIRLSV